MSVQLEIVKFRDVVPARQITRFVPGVEPPMLELKGQDFTSVEEILINDLKAPEFMIVDKQTIWATLPDTNTQFRSIILLSSKFTKTKVPSSVTFKLGDNPKNIEGLLKLMQLFMKWLLQSPGSDVFDPDRGGGLQRVIGNVSTTRNMQPFKVTLSRAISQTATQIKNAQSASPDMPLNERLLSADILGLSVQSSTMTAIVRVSLKSMAGQSAVTDLEL